MWTNTFSLSPWRQLSLLRFLARYLTWFLSSLQLSDGFQKCFLFFAFRLSTVLLLLGWKYYFSWLFVSQAKPEVSDCFLNSLKPEAFIYFRATSIIRRNPDIRWNQFLSLCVFEVFLFHFILFCLFGLVWFKSDWSSIFSFCHIRTNFVSPPIHLSFSICVQLLNTVNVSFLIFSVLWVYTF